MGKKSTAREGFGPLGPALPPMPPAREGQVLEIQYGNNIEIRKVLMRFNAATDNLILTPEDAEDVAHKLLYHAKAARGEKPS